MSDTARSLRDSLNSDPEALPEVAARYLNGALANAHGEFSFASADATHARVTELRQTRELFPEAKLPPLWGVPVAIKDNNDVAGMPTSHGTNALPPLVATADSPVTEKLREAGALIIGKTATPEFAIAGYSETEVGSSVTNPRAPTLNAGGSSAGAAAAVAAGTLPFAPGNDAGGSVRIPAAACGVVGLKPGRGTLTVDGTPQRSTLADGTELFLPMGVSGALGRNAADTALLYEAMGGSVPDSPAPSGLRIGISAATPFDSSLAPELDPQMRTAWEQAAASLSELGHSVKQAEFRYLEGYEENFTVNWYGEFASTLFTAQQLEHLGGFARYSWEQGRSLTDRARVDAAGFLDDFAADTAGQWEAYDVVLTPTLAFAPPALGTFHDIAVEENFRHQCEWLPYTSMVNITGHAAITVPVMEMDNGLLASVQLIARAGREGLLLQLAEQLELG